jgi:ribosomal protein S18 acetylase RimI-like enzyme
MNEVIAVPENRRREALQHLLGGKRLSAIQRLESSGRLAPDSLWAVESPSGSLAAVALSIPNTGRTATVLASRPKKPADIPMVTRVVTASRDAASGGGIDLLQSLLSPEDALSLEAFQRASFEFLADLHTLKLRVGTPKEPPSLPRDITLADVSDDELTATMEATYEDTLDCANLRGLRSTQDILDGHRSGGIAYEELTQIVMRGDMPIGCAIVTCGPQSIADLAYIGLIPSVRGTGLGEKVLQHMVFRASLRRIRFVRLAVDDVNTPARLMYRRAGFSRESTQRAVIHSVKRLQVDSDRLGMSTTD